ncbi:LpxL/LpxP family acyltransferase [Paraglaciecola polaris]|uniref:Lipid A biosynthesis lauroyl acyltransferase n=1 Tax=Paraglaciecola polaris LMG 21857 TaxID=1129793 RepID=K6ZT66_9ALTE|nr:hypothetical protein [Paraglaciecola polaris]GAC33477.1 hypothetical protein GPLA_2579 [Paraglaciecola polaris LMG 21857]
MSFEKFKPAYLHPKYWLSWLIVGFTWLLAQIPRPWQSGISGWVARRLANSRNSRIRTIRRNIDLCFIEKSEAEREKLVVANLSSSVLGIGRINTPVIFPIYNKKQAISNRQVIINPLAVPLLSTNQ